MKRYVKSSTDDLLQTAITLINDYAESEYGGQYDVGKGDLSDVGIMYSTSGGMNEVELQVSADLLNYKINYYVNGELRHTDSYNSLQELVDRELSDLDFNWIYSNALDYVTNDDYDPEYSSDYMR